MWIQHGESFVGFSSRFIKDVIEDFPKVNRSASFVDSSDSFRLGEICHHWHWLPFSVFPESIAKFPSSFRPQRFSQLSFQRFTVFFSFSDFIRALSHFGRSPSCLTFFSLSCRKAFVGGLTPDTTEEDLKTYFGTYGEVQHAVVKRDPASGSSRRFAFVTFAYADGLTKVCRVE